MIALEHKGTLFVGSKQIQNIQELWFIARCKDEENAEALANILNAKEKLGCGYSQEIEDQLNKIKTKRFVSEVMPKLNGALQ